MKEDSAITTRKPKLIEKVRITSPRNIQIPKYYYIYTLRSLKEHKFYTGYTNNLKKRIKENNNGEVESTKNRTPLQPAYREGCLCQRDPKLTTGDIINRAA